MRESDIQIFLFFEDGTEYFPYGRAIRFNGDPQPIQPEPSYGWVAIPIIIFVVLLIAAIILIIIFMKKRRENVFANVSVVLERPDFSELAFGKDGNNIEFIGIPDDEYELFEDVFIFNSC